MLKLLNVVVYGELLRRLHDALSQCYTTNGVDDVPHFFNSLQTLHQDESRFFTPVPGAEKAWERLGRRVKAADEGVAESDIPFTDTDIPALFQYMKTKLGGLKVHTGTKDLINLAIALRRLPALVALKCTSTFLQNHATSLIKYHIFKANNVENEVDLELHFADLAELRGNVLLYDAMLCTGVKPEWVAWACGIPEVDAEAAVCVAKDAVASLAEHYQQQRATPFVKTSTIVMDFANSAHPVHLLRDAIDKVLTAMKHTSYEDFELRALLATLNSVQPDLQTLCQHQVPRSHDWMTSVDPEFVRSRNLAGTARDLMQHAVNMATAIASRAKTGVPWVHNDGDGVVLKFKGLPLELVQRIMVCDSDESTQAWNGKLPSLLMESWKLLGYRATVDPYLYQTTDMDPASGRIRTRHITGVRLTNPQNPTDTFLIHEKLIQLGASRGSIPFMFVPSLEKIRTIFRWQGEAQRNAAARADAIMLEPHFILYHAEMRAKYNELFYEANDMISRRADAACHAVCMNNYAWMKMMDYLFSLVRESVPVAEGINKDMVATSTGGPVFEGAAVCIPDDVFEWEPPGPGEDTPERHDTYTCIISRLTERWVTVTFDERNGTDGRWQWPRDTFKTEWVINEHSEGDESDEDGYDSEPEPEDIPDALAQLEFNDDVTADDGDTAGEADDSRITWGRANPTAAHGIPMPTNFAKRTRARISLRGGLSFLGFLFSILSEEETIGKWTKYTNEKRAGYFKVLDDMQVDHGERIWGKPCPKFEAREVKGMLAILLIKGVARVKNMDDAFSMDRNLHNEGIASIMSKSRFNQCWRFFRVSDPTTAQSKLTPRSPPIVDPLTGEKTEYDHLYWVREFHDGLRAQLLRVFEVGGVAAVDEFLCGSRHHKSYHRHIPGKPHPHGILIYIVASVYCPDVDNTKDKQ
ncbi:hypothetical protein CYMTET_35417 [Cymbomonas tetramitiformis]|uniref:PiggyBac transposable element-derived protein domain-containing protein n=1 Tax=Cymbomonas tetramitiformis TaxID=36881 RepID=A0AAE0F964_9CHLO|nr:hypothetical protein CYMTET_35417 [Cymbomonas tetramitiformis]